MASVNKVILVARLGGDPVIRETPDGKTVVSFSVATSENWKDKNGEKVEKTTWHNIVVFDKLAKICEQFLTKGKQVYLEGRIQHRSYEKDGETKYISEVVVHQMQMLDSKKASDEGIDSDGLDF